jgi:hypothetical protein
MTGSILLENRIVAALQRGLRKPPRYIAARLWHEAKGRSERYLTPRRAGRMTAARLAAQLGHADVNGWWNALAQRPYVTEAIEGEALERVCPGERERVLSAAERAVAHRVSLLGSGEVALGEEIDWSRDYKTGIRWDRGYFRDYRYNDLDRPSDVKVPWEISRMQWMIPLGQAYALTGEDGFAVTARELIESWIRDNPYAHSINWACTMDVALRIVSWSWLFHAFKDAPAWRPPGFRGRFLEALFQHGDFTARNLEHSDVNGNHYTADAAGLVFAGLFFGEGEAPERWSSRGWDILKGEIDLQVYEDGVDFEASVPYHRLVKELFLYPALYRRRLGLEIPRDYRERLLAMARFTEAYSRADGTVPLWGDADDARTLPFSAHPINDHRYLFAIAGLEFGDAELTEAFSGRRSEIAWLLGPERAQALPNRGQREEPRPSAAFAAGGFYVLRNAADHVFIDCGPLGLAGRGGHGHNDLLSFEAMLAGVHLVSDCGAYLYTANYRERNNFRSTAYHNTPQVDGAEINRFVRPDYLWFLHNDAEFAVEALAFGDDADRISMSHDGYQRLASPVRVKREIVLDHRTHSLALNDSFESDGEHLFEVPLHLAVGVSAQQDGKALCLTAGERAFRLSWSPEGNWQLEVGQGRISPTYGVVLPCVRLRWARRGRPAPLRILIEPKAGK